MPVPLVIKCEGLKDDTFLRRFVDLPKLLQILVDEQMFSPSLGQLAQGDPFESAIYSRSKYEEMGASEREEYAINLLEHIPRHVMIRNARERRG